MIPGMHKSDVQCPDCRAGYRRVELSSRKGQAGTFHCKVCNGALEVFDGTHEIAYRLTVLPLNLAERADRKLPD
jgi:transposase-like protein